MQLLCGKETAEHIAGIIHPKYQVHGFSVHLTVKTIHAIDPTGKVDFGGGEYAPAGRIPLEAHQFRPEDNYRWWELDKEAYFVECNETLNLAADQIALIEPEDRLLRAGAWHAPIFVRGQVNPIELLLTVGVAQLRVKENARIARVRLFSIGDPVKPEKAARKVSAAKSAGSRRK
jgi:deoxycytidine triphosphate deaminase